MFNRRVYVLLPALSLFMAFLPATAEDATSKSAPTSADLTFASPGDKAQAIKELMKTMRTEQNARMGMDTMVQQQIKGMNIGLANHIDADPKLTTEEKMEAKRKAIDTLDKMMRRFSQILSEKVDMASLVQNTYGELYDKYFTLAEIQDLNRFYQSPTGQKTLDTMPRLLQEALTKINPVVLGRLKEANQQLEQEVREGKLK